MNRLIVLLVIVSAVPACAAQGPDSLRIGIHQAESREHVWDDVKLVKGVGAFVHGKACAVRGDLTQAIAEFQKGAKKNKQAAYYNIGLTYFHMHEYRTAIDYFRKAERIRPDARSRAYRQTATRLLKEGAKTQKR